jgi:hypothetical protein
MRDPETIDSELRLLTALRRAARERGGPLPSVAAADALLDERNNNPRHGTRRAGALSVYGSNVGSGAGFGSPGWGSRDQRLERQEMATGKRPASDAARILADPKSTKKEREVAASDLAQAKKKK